MRTRARGWVGEKGLPGREGPRWPRQEGPGWPQGRVAGRGCGLPSDRHSLVKAPGRERVQMEPVLRGPKLRCLDPCLSGQQQASLCGHFRSYLDTFSFLEDFLRAVIFRATIYERLL